jgi:hypothetical protein
MGSQFRTTVDALLAYKGWHWLDALFKREPAGPAQRRKAPSMLFNILPRSRPRSSLDRPVTGLRQLKSRGDRRPPAESKGIWTLRSVVQCDRAKIGIRSRIFFPVILAIQPRPRIPVTRRFCDF